MIEFKIGDFDYYQDHKLLIAKDWKMLEKHLHILWSGQPVSKRQFVIQGKRKMTFVKNNLSNEWNVVYKVWPEASGIFPFYGDDGFIAAFIQRLNMNGESKLPPRQTPML